MKDPSVKALPDTSASSQSQFKKSVNLPLGVKGLAVKLERLGAEKVNLRALLHELLSVVALVGLGGGLGLLRSTSHSFRCDMVMRRTILFF